ncbi:hypothetical protein ADIS_4708 [Lunatimonas lonarensis]|uniref:Uncharacterized protein n=1 Tax=Lunatimonas lonarensis TaxID=1232681 RepID=R7ZL59_9BACT|nr:hypothetical protein ADIS_4708 [Lunatimonas lonarensis]
MVSSIPDAHAGHTQHLRKHGAVQSIKKIQYLKKKLGVGWKRTAANACLAADRPAVSKLNPVMAHFKRP